MTRGAGAALLVAVSLGTAASAGERVVFGDGRTLEVASWQASGDSIRLELPGGGTLYVPMDRVLDVESVGEAPASRTLPGSDPGWRRLAGRYADLVETTARRHGLDPFLLTAVAKVESDFDPLALSHKGACGILQLIPETADRFGVDDVFDVEQNLDGGARYLRWLLRRFDGRLELALAAYNAGERAVERHGGIPPYVETRRYVTRVLGHLP